MPVLWMISGIQRLNSCRCCSRIQILTQHGVRMCVEPMAVPVLIISRLSPQLRKRLNVAGGSSPFVASFRSQMNRTTSVLSGLLYELQNVPQAILHSGFIDIDSEINWVAE